MYYVIVFGDNLPTNNVSLLIELYFYPFNLIFGFVLYREYRTLISFLISDKQ